MAYHRSTYRANNNRIRNLEPVGDHRKIYSTFKTFYDDRLETSWKALTCKQQLYDDYISSS